MKVSLVVTTYNWPEALRFVLHSVRQQSVKPDQVIIADDGSGPETAAVIREVLGASGLRWSHVRHEDQGVRQSRIKNLAVKQTDCDYLIFMDQDVVAHPRFVEDHLGAAQRDCFLQGKRVLLSERYTCRILKERKFQIPSLFSKGIKNRKNAVRSMKLAKLFSRTKKFEASLRGCNLSMYRDDFIRVNGFDEIYDQSWGREDSDICYRLFHNGIRAKVLWFAALQYHLRHRVTADWDKRRLDAEIQKNLNEKRIKAIQGFSQLSLEGGVVGSSR